MGHAWIWPRQKNPLGICNFLVEFRIWEKKIHTWKMKKKKGHRPPPPEFTRVLPVWVHQTLTSSSSSRSSSSFAMLSFNFTCKFFQPTRQEPSWWFFFNHPTEKYVLGKLDSFILPQGSGWKWKKYVSCHHLDFEAPWFYWHSEKGEPTRKA